MKALLKIIVGVFFILNTLSAHSQGFLQDYELSFGYSFQKQDRRLFLFPSRDVIIEMEKSIHDYQLELTVNKNFIVWNNFSSAIGIGYSMNVNNFSRPFDHNYFTGEGTLELRRIKSYIIHNLRVYDNLKYKLFGDEKKNLSIIIPVGLNIELNKHIKGSHGNWSRNKWNVGLNNVDIYTGLSYRSNKFVLSLSYRLLNIQKIDQVIFYNILSSANHLELLDKKYECRNPDNFKVNVGYKF